MTQSSISDILLCPTFACITAAIGMQYITYLHPATFSQVVVVSAWVAAVVTASLAMIFSRHG